MSVTRTADGDYEIKYLVGKEQRTWTFVPATKIDPTIFSQVDLGQEPGYYSYSYRFGNGRRARQDLAVVDFPVMDIKAVRVETPVGWDSVPAPKKDRLSWIVAPPGAKLDGLAPASEASGFRLTSALLPGPVDAWCEGNAELAMPADLPPQVMQRLEQTGVMLNHVTTPVLAPRISPGLNEPELTAAVLTSRVMGSYSLAFQLSQHPAKLEIMAALRDAMENLAKDPSAGTRALDRAAGLALDAGHDPWAETLGRGLAFCIRAIKERFRLSS